MRSILRILKKQRPCHRLQQRDGSQSSAARQRWYREKRIAESEEAACRNRLRALTRAFTQALAAAATAGISDPSPAPDPCCIVSGSLRRVRSNTAAIQLAVCIGGAWTRRSDHLCVFSCTGTDPHYPHAE